MGLEMHIEGRSQGIICVYAPTEEAERTVKDTLYEQLGELLERMKTRCDDRVVIAGDLNAVIGDCLVAAAKRSVGPRNKDYSKTTNDNGRRLLALCKEKSMCLMNTVVGGTHHQPGKEGVYTRTIDFILMPTSQRKFVKTCRTVGSMDYTGTIRSDHRMVEMVWNRTAHINKDRVVRQKKAERPPRIDFDKAAADPSMRRQVNENIRQELGTNWTKDVTFESAFKRFRNILVDSYAKVVPGEATKRTNADWFVNNKATLEPLIRQKIDLFHKTKNGNSDRGNGDVI
jgi:hypothetical protein